MIRDLASVLAVSFTNIYYVMQSVFTEYLMYLVGYCKEIIIFDMLVFTWCIDVHVVQYYYYYYEMYSGPVVEQLVCGTR